MIDLSSAQVDNNRIISGAFFATIVVSVIKKKKQITFPAPA